VLTAEAEDLPDAAVLAAMRIAAGFNRRTARSIAKALTAIAKQVADAPDTPGWIRGRVSRWPMPRPGWR